LDKISTVPRAIHRSFQHLLACMACPFRLLQALGGAADFLAVAPCADGEEKDGSSEREPRKRPPPEAAQRECECRDHWRPRCQSLTRVQTTSATPASARAMNSQRALESHGNSGTNASCVSASACCASSTPV